MLISILSATRQNLCSLHSAAHTPVLYLLGCISLPLLFVLSSHYQLGPTFLFSATTNSLLSPRSLTHFAFGSSSFYHDIILSHFITASNILALKQNTFLTKSPHSQMGCAQSRIDNEESVARCKERKNLMKDAVIARNAFAAGHSGYAMALKNTGAALSDYGHGESHVTHELHQPPLDTSSEPPPPPPPPMEDNLPPPPPPLPNFSPSPLKRAATMPAITMQHEKPSRGLDSVAIAEEDEEEEDNIKASKGNGGQSLKKGGSVASSSPPRTPETKPVPPMPESKGMAWDYFFMVDNMPGPSLGEEDEIEDENEESEAMGYEEAENVGGGVGNMGNGMNEVEPKTPEKVEEHVQEEIVEAVKEAKHIEHSKTAPPDFRRAMKVAPSVSLMQILNALDDHFLKASESAQEVTKMLEATRLHYHSNFADNRGHIDHSARVMRVITWNRSFRGVSNGDGTKDDFDSEDYETHATVLDKLLAWEKKLYEEQAELMKFEYQRKVALLNKQKKRSASAESLEKTKAAVSHLHTRYIVDMQSMDSTVSEVNHIRDAQLYPKLVALVNGMASMWESMCIHHDSQLKIVTELKSLDISQAPKETTKHHYDRTVQLCNVVQEWHLQFEKLVTHQKQYIQALSSWLKLNLIPIESSLKEKISSPPKAQNPPIQALLQAWHDYVDRLPDELAKSAISSFAAVIKTIILQQEEEMKLKEKCEETRKEYLRKNQAFEEWYQKYLQRRGPDEIDHDRGEEVNTNNPVSEKQFVVESLKKRLEEEIESHQKQCVQVREKSLQSLKTRLPELFRAMSDYGHTCADAYEKLKSISHSKGGAA
ncbi:nitrate regulatory gene2 protein [Senna tora]|uniref:Nitrate regulatory gene2 protein n=1 Tax=Senna tora TaxID=362788 RepID=A0A834T7B4_9FABA|nr:nitrate regulatory gene2 protein [Senna tora]